MEEEIKYTLNGAVDIEELKELFQSAGLHRPEDSLSLRKMLIHAKLIVTARHQNQLVGIARALTDFSSCCFLSEVAVRQEYEQRNIASKMLDLIRKEVEEDCDLIMLVPPGQEERSKELGFTKAENLFMIPRQYR